MRVLICGDRNWQNRTMIADFVKSLSSSDVIIEGGAMGADRIALQEARKRGIKVKEYYAEWSKYGKAAGPIRNQKMLREGKPDKIVAFHNDLSRSKGTKNMVELAKEHNIPLEHYR